MLVSRAPQPMLRPFVKTLWVTDGAADVDTARRELVVPTGTMHIVFRLDQPLRLYAGLSDREGQTIGCSIAGGARAGYYVRDVSQPSRSVGAQLQPMAAGPLLGVPAHELADRHTLLDDVWGRDVQTIRERLLEADQPAAQLEIFEAFLAARLPRVRGVHPAIARAFQQLSAASDVRELVRDSGYSHRQFNALFRQTVGLTPKLYTRLLRFERSLARLRAASRSAAGIALDEGYSDQSHLIRDFREFTGLAPSRYRALAPGFSHHIPLAD